MADEYDDLLQQMAELKNQNETLLKQIEDGHPKDINRQYKDRLFKFIFGNPEKKQWALSLYNAINGTHYTDPDELEFNTIGDAVYMGMKNDVSFLISSEMNLWEQQSSYNPNMPMRLFLYAAKLYDKYIQTSDYYLYSGTLQKIPRPFCVCFYNGKRDQSDRQILRLSDAYEGAGDIEVKVTMLNINYGKNQVLMEACQPLREYAWLVDEVRQNQNEKMNLDSAVDRALRAMPDHFLIKPFLLGNRAEVKSMLITEYNEQKEFEKERREGRREGIQQKSEAVAMELIRRGFSAEDVAAISGLPEGTVKAMLEKQKKTIMA